MYFHGRDRWVIPENVWNPSSRPDTFGPESSQCVAARHCRDARNYRLDDRIKKKKKLINLRRRFFTEFPKFPLLPLPSVLCYTIKNVPTWAYTHNSCTVCPKSHQNAVKSWSCKRKIFNFDAQNARFENKKSENLLHLNLKDVNFRFLNGNLLFFVWYSNGILTPLIFFPKCAFCYHFSGMVWRYITLIKASKSQIKKKTNFGFTN